MVDSTKRNVPFINEIRMFAKLQINFKAFHMEIKKMKKVVCNVLPGWEGCTGYAISEHT